MKPKQTLHICLMGKGVVSDWELISRLSSRHDITLINRQNLKLRERTLHDADVLIFDCLNWNSPDSELQNFLSVISSTFPRLLVLLTNGGLTKEQIARAFREGAKDYFPEPRETSLLIERLEFLAGCTSKREAGAACISK